MGFQPVPQVLPSNLLPHIDTAKTIGILTVQVTTGVPERAGLTSKKCAVFQCLSVFKMQSKIYNRFTYCPLLSLSLIVEKSIGFLITFL